MGFGLASGAGDGVLPDSVRAALPQIVGLGLFSNLAVLVVALFVMHAVDRALGGDSALTLALLALMVCTAAAGTVLLRLLRDGSVDPEEGEGNALCAFVRDGLPDLLALAAVPLFVAALALLHGGLAAAVLAAGAVAVLLPRLAEGVARFVVLTAAVALLADGQVTPGAAVAALMLGGRVVAAGGSAGTTLGMAAAALRGVPVQWQGLPRLPALPAQPGGGQLSAMVASGGR